MSDNTPGEQAETPRDQCSYPGCTRPRRPDPATGRPSRYCELADDGGPVHNRATAFKARRTGEAGVSTLEDALTAAPVSMARATLDQRLAEFPSRIADIRGYLDGLVEAMRTAGDIEAAGAEVEDAHRDALSKVTEAERRASTAERTARLANDRAEKAERDREEADLLAEEAAAETAQVREQTQAEITAIRSEADAAVTRAQQELSDAVAEHQTRLAERDAELERARQEVAAAKLDTASALAAHRAAEETVTRERETALTLRRELDETRRLAEEARQRLQAELDSARAATQRAAGETADIRVELATTQAEAAATRRAAEVDRAAVVTLTDDLERQREETRTERDALRAAHAEQLAQARRDADERVHALNEALTVATAAAETYRAQLGTAPNQPAKRTARKTIP